MKESKSRKAFKICNIALMVIFMAIFFIPYWMIIVASVSSEKSLARNGYMLFPFEIDFSAYNYLFTNDNYILASIKNSVFITLVGTLLSLAVTIMYAYSMSRKYMPGRQFFNSFAIFTMLFGGGLVPYYLVVTGLGLRDSLWAIILPSLMSAWNMILIRNYFFTIPDSLEEAAKMDGASHIRILVQIYIPMSMPVIATITLFCAVGFWNNWFGPLLFIETKSKYPIQYLIRDMLSQLEAINNADGGNVGGDVIALPLISSRMAAIVLASLPVVMIYPFLQKYFINGVMLGSVKE